MRSVLKLVGVAVTMSACVGRGASTSVTTQESRGGAGDKVGVDLLVTDDVGAAIPCDQGTMQVSVSASMNGSAGPFRSIDSDRIVVQCATGAADVAIVVDNSGSEVGHLAAQQAGAGLLVDSVLAAGGRASVTRVSTNSSILQPLTDDGAALHSAIDSLQITNGWTSLWDGIRMSNQTLGGQIQTTSDPGDVHEFCTDTRKLAIVAFTDGRDNNSADQQSYNHVAYPGDGIATTENDLEKLSVGHTSTPIYTIGLGDGVDEMALTSLAQSTGGTYHALTDVEQVQSAYADISNYFGSAREVCTDLPWSVCGDVTVETDWTWTGTDGSTLTGTNQSTTYIPCTAERGPGREATIVMTMSDNQLDEETVGRLASNTVDWVTPVSNPKVLVVLDDGNHGEYVSDAQYVHDELVLRHYDATYMEEETGGITTDDIAGYDVVWFCNPGYPFDDARSVDTLMAALQAGKGVVAQGDDITQSMGESFPVTPLTHLNFVDNGITSKCGQLTDNDQGENLRVQLGSGHPLVDGIENTSFLYGNDIDFSTPADSTVQVLGWASPDGGGCPADQRPAVTVVDPPPTVIN